MLLDDDERDVVSAADDFAILVSDHAADRWRKRVGSAAYGLGISDEVRTAMREGRFGTDPPPCFRYSRDASALFAWSADRERLYVVKVHELLENAWVVVTVVTRDAVPDAPDPIAVSPPCAPFASAPRLEVSMADLVRDLPIDMSPEPLHLPASARHEARVTKAKGKWTVTCSCGNFRTVGNEIRRHFIETAWGAHRNEL